VTGPVIAALVIGAVLFGLGWITGRRTLAAERALTVAAERKRNALIGELLTLHATLLASGQQRTADQIARILWPDDAPTEVLDFERFRRDLRAVGDQMATEGWFKTEGWR
jgi:hypothetical protein